MGDQTMDRRNVLMAFVLMFVASGFADAADNRAKEQAAFRKAGQDALNALYKAQPSARKAVESAAGYAAFSNFGMKILIAGGGTGKGDDVHEDGRDPGGPRLRCEEVPARMGVRERAGAQFVHQLRLGIRWAGNG